MHPLEFRLYVVTDRLLVGGVDAMLDMLGRLAQGLPAGSLGIEVREKDMSARELVTLVERLISRVRPMGVPVIVNDRLDVALATGANGVHLPAAGIRAIDVRRAFTGLIGVSTHSTDEIASLDPDWADFATFGPVFDTPSKRAYGPPKGIDSLGDAVRAAGIPILALGGIGPANAVSLRGTGIAGIAAISSILGADDPLAAGLMLLESLGP